MRLVIQFCLIVASPVMLFVYIRNSFRNVDNIHANYELNYAE